MATTKNASCKSSKVFLLGIILIFSMSSFLSSQTIIKEEIELPESAIKSIIQGIQTGNEGVRKSCIYFAGKYKIRETSKYLMEKLADTEDSELCSMLIWSLYQIGNNSYCTKLNSVVKNHNSMELRNFCSLLGKIKEYEMALENNN